VAGHIDHPAFLLFRVEVGDGGALIDLADLVDKIGIKKHPLRHGRPLTVILPGVDVGDDPDIADLLEMARHGYTNLNRLEKWNFTMFFAVVYRTDTRKNINRATIERLRQFGCCPVQSYDGGSVLFLSDVSSFNPKRGTHAN